MINCLLHGILILLSIRIVIIWCACFQIPLTSMQPIHQKWCAHEYKRIAIMSNTFLFGFDFQKATNSKMVWKVDKIVHWGRNKSKPKSFTTLRMIETTTKKYPQNCWLYQSFFLIQVERILFTTARLGSMAHERDRERKKSRRARASAKNYEFQIWKCFIFQHRSIVHYVIYCNAVQQDKGIFQQK